MTTSTLCLFQKRRAGRWCFVLFASTKQKVSAAKQLFSNTWLWMKVIAMTTQRACSRRLYQEPTSSPPLWGMQRKTPSQSTSWWTALTTPCSVVPPRLWAATACRYSWGWDRGCGWWHWIIVLMHRLYLLESWHSPSCDMLVLLMMMMMMMMMFIIITTSTYLLESWHSPSCDMLVLLLMTMMMMMMMFIIITTSTSFARVCTWYFSGKNCCVIEILCCCCWYCYYSALPSRPAVVCPSLLLLKLVAVVSTSVYYAQSTFAVISGWVAIVVTISITIAIIKASSLILLLLKLVVLYYYY